MRILLINSFYYPSFVGGAEISVQLLAEGLTKAGNQVYVLTTGPANKVYRVNRVTVISLKQRNIYSTYGGAGNANGALKSLWHFIDSCNIFYHFSISAILKKIHPDLVHTNTIQGFSPFIWKTIKDNKIPLVHTTRDYYLLCHKCSLFNNDKNCDTLCLPCKVTNSVKRNFISYPDYFIGISQYILNKHKAFLQIPDQLSNVVYNAAKSSADAEGRPVTEKIHFGYIGRIAEDKGVLYLANELAKLSDTQKLSLKIIFAGKGDPQFITQLQGKLKGIEYEFMGVSKPDDFYQQIDVLIVPALWNEPFGRTVIESLSYSVPVCQSDRGGLKEIYDPNSSWIYSPDEDNLTTVIGHILDNKNEIADKKKNCVKYADDFSVDNYIKNHLRLYHQIANPQPELSKTKSYPVLHNQ
ncbi:glycosyltransferase family 4 protein [Mucilaginibacter sabulilitoris]|uniref:Glycosyltransferase family 4 protein n=1 Tax=Mucilaginibacter sabulilitoris TaxID=1173583 RepID=A0ABZ0TMM5_9SPHI|nr:glycosyltransferase family 4 protein [Mucilaginibacter sabulilitoris]WPU92425.1 glycosyltransferase family 4 protein [Mucilaginibacter sabulilitoris]